MALKSRGKGEGDIGLYNWRLSWDYRRFRTDIFTEQREMTKDDFVIICGDFGFWDESGEQKYWRKWLSEKPFTTLWVAGNHENYDLLKTYPMER